MGGRHRRRRAGQGEGEGVGGGAGVGGGVLGVEADVGVDRKGREGVLERLDVGVQLVLGELHEALDLAEGGDTRGGKGEEGGEGVGGGKASGVGVGVGGEVCGDECQLLVDGAQTVLRSLQRLAHVQRHRS